MANITNELNQAIELLESINTTHQYLLKGICPESAREILFADESSSLLTLTEHLEEMKSILNEPVNMKVA